MTNTANNRFSITAFAIAACAFVALHGSMLMGFEHLASSNQAVTDGGTSLAKVNATPRTVTLDRVVVSSRRA